MVNDVTSIEGIEVWELELRGARLKFRGPETSEEEGKMGDCVPVMLSVGGKDWLFRGALRWSSSWICGDSKCSVGICRMVEVDKNLYGLCEHREWWKGKEAGSDGATQALLMTGQNWQCGIKWILLVQSRGSAARGLRVTGCESQLNSRC